MLTRRGFLCATAPLLLTSCVNEQHAVVGTAAISTDPWSCPEAETQVTEVSNAKYRLEGCSQEAVYNCNFSFNPPRCWR
ncbi:MAG: hypothetical protein JW751_31250 [Polyangiaceae bacterium]|nr:hypothetical protein [Polyangiaceae bacterium]